MEYSLVLGIIVGVSLSYRLRKRTAATEKLIFSVAAVAKKNFRKGLVLNLFDNLEKQINRARVKMFVRLLFYIL